MYGFSLPGSFYRKDESLPPEQRYYDGCASVRDEIWQCLAASQL